MRPVRRHLSPAERLVRLIADPALCGRFPLTTRRLMREAVEVGVSSLPVPLGDRPLFDKERWLWFWQLAPMLSMNTPPCRFVSRHASRAFTVVPATTQEN